MKLRFYILFLALSLISGFSVAQDYKSVIEKRFMTYSKHMIDKEFEQALDYVVEDFFSILPKKQMIILFEKLYNNPEMEYKISAPENIVIGKRQKIEGKYYTIIEYSMDLMMKFDLEEEEGETEEDQELARNIIKLALENQFGEGKVKYDDQTGFFEINSEKKACAVLSDAAGWKFIIIEKDKKEILKRILPEKILKKI